MVNVLLFAAIIPLGITIASYSIKSASYRLGLLSVPFWAIYGGYCYSFTTSTTAFTTWYGYLGFVSIINAIIMLILMNRMRKVQDKEEYLEGVNDDEPDEFNDFELGQIKGKSSEIRERAKKRRLNRMLNPK